MAMETQELPILHISVRGLVEFILRNGDLDVRHRANPEEAMQEGSRIHRKLQKEGGTAYHAEVPLRFLWNTEHFALELSGRADGIILPDDDPVATIDEIKGTYRKLRRMRAPEAVHLAQAKCYAFMYLAEKQGKEAAGGAGATSENAGEMPSDSDPASPLLPDVAPDRIRVQMTYVHLESEQIRRFEEEYTFQELNVWFYQLLEEYRKWADHLVEHQRNREASIADLTFPYPYREGQKTLMGQVYQTISEGKKLFIEAPTGVGKTLAALYPAIKALGEGKSSRIFYLTAKTVTRTVASGTVQLLRSKGLRLKSLTLTAKEKICCNGEVQCNPDACPCARGHFDRVNEALFRLLTSEDDLNRETILQYALQYQICPYEFSLDLSLFADLVICDYNYAFDPVAYLRRFFASSRKESYIFLIDEAHNLVDRGREMFSASLSREDLSRMKRQAKGYELLAGASRAAGKCIKLLNGYRALSAEEDLYLELTSVGEFAEEVQKLCDQLAKVLDHESEGDEEEYTETEALPAGQLSLFQEEALPEPAKRHGSSSGLRLPPELRESVLQLYFQVSFFLDIASIMDGNYKIFCREDAENGYFLSLSCIDPARNLSEAMLRAGSVILFSATMLPIGYYKKLLGGGSEDYEVYAASVFDPAKCGLFIAGDVTSRYSRRGAEEYTKIAEYIRRITSVHPGNYMVFFPSYSFMKQVEGAFHSVLHLSGCYEEVSLAVSDENGELPSDGTTVFRQGAEILRLIVQNRRMSEADRDAFLAEFTSRASDVCAPDTSSPLLSSSEDSSTGISGVFPASSSASSLIGFCVLGGIFSEGIDLTGESLIGAIIVGTGLPLVCRENELIRSHFDEDGLGFDYAYRFPGMNKVLQAAGRVIRTMEDSGIVALLDDRFLSLSYRRLFPREWERFRVVSLSDVSVALSDFWDSL